MPTNTSTALARNGTRHPTRKNLRVGRPAREQQEHRARAARSRCGAPSCGNMPYHARLPGGAFSIASSTAPPHSPPSPRPWPKRHNASSSGAAMPIDAYVGSRPIDTVDSPIVSSAATSVALRPMRSPKWPNSAEPIGRAKKRDRERRERLQRRRRGVGGREEQLRKHQDGGGRVDVEVEELDRGADQAGEQHVARAVTSRARPRAPTRWSRRHRYVTRSGPKDVTAE